MLRLAASCLAPEAPLAELWPVRTEENAFFFYGGVRDTERVGVLLQIEEIKCAFGGGQCTKKRNVCLLIGTEEKWDQTCLCFRDKNTLKKKISSQQIKQKSQDQRLRGMVTQCTGYALRFSLFYVLISADFLWHLQERVEGVVIHSLSCFCKYWDCNKGSWELLWLPVKSCLYCWCWELLR